jgi:hypothetical protein
MWIPFYNNEKIHWMGLKSSKQKRIRHWKNEIYEDSSKES